MSKKTLEHLSSLMDGETSQETGLFLTRRVCADRELSQTWERYHLIRDCMRIANRLGVPFTFPARHPFMPLPALRLAPRALSSRAFLALHRPYGLRCFLCLR